MADNMAALPGNLSRLQLDKSMPTTDTEYVGTDPSSFGGDDAPSEKEVRHVKMHPATGELFTRHVLITGRTDWPGSDVPYRDLVIAIKDVF
jgi:hypothetical protein